MRNVSDTFYPSSVHSPNWWNIELKQKIYTQYNGCHVREITQNMKGTLNNEHTWLKAVKTSYPLQKCVKSWNLLCMKR